MIRRLSFRADELISSFQAKGARVVIAFLDACRNNPFEAAGVRGVGSSRGLARIDPPRGSFILYSAGVGQSALDQLSDEDTDAHSVLTRVYIAELQQPNLSLIEIAKETQVHVRDLTLARGYDQVPAYYDEIVGNFVLSSSAPSEPTVIAKGITDE